METLSRNAQVVKYFVQRAPSELGVVKLQKLAYLADLYAREYLGHPVSGFDYMYYKHGPFDADLYTAIEELERADYVETRRHSLLGGRNKRGVVNKGRFTAFEFTRPEKEILDYVAEVYENEPLERILVEVYETTPMKIASRNERIPMEIVDNRAKRALGYDLETVLSEEAEIDRGNYVLASDFFDGLRAETLAADAGEHHPLHS
jgi:hypothetical protein